MGFMDGMGTGIGYWALEKGVKLGSTVLLCGFVRAAGVEAMQEQQNPYFPEDGRGIVANTLYYSGRNISDLFHLLAVVNDATKSSSLEPAAPAPGDFG